MLYFTVVKKVDIAKTVKYIDVKTVKIDSIVGTLKKRNKKLVTDWC